MRLGGKIYLTIDDYKKLLHDELLTIGHGSEIVLRPVTGPDGASFVKLGFELTIEDMPSRELMLAWVNAFYDRDEALFMDLRERIAQQLQGKKVLEQ